MQYLSLDPRPASREGEIEKLKNLKASGALLVGFEVTVPELAEVFDYNIDPQHIGGDHTQSCIQAVAEGAYERAQSQLMHLKATGEAELVFATVRADLDSVGGMAIALMLNECGESYLEYCSDRISPDVFSRVDAVHKADTFANSGVWEPHPLFSGGYEQTELAAIARAVADFKVPLEQRVKWMYRWLDTGEEPEGYRKAYNKEREEICLALEYGETKVKEYKDDSDEDCTVVTAVVSKLRAATSIGYQTAPVVVAYNPEFPDREVGSIKKYTICQYAPGYVNLQLVFSDLSYKEPGWGGSPVIGGSPQGVSSSLSIEEVVAVVKSRLLHNLWAKETDPAFSGGEVKRSQGWMKVAWDVLKGSAEDSASYYQENNLPFKVLPCGINPN